MKYSYAVLGLLLFGMFGLVFLVMFESITINNESEYYVLKEAMEASMLESIDWQCFENRNLDGGCNGSLKIREQQFVENFTKRFAASINGDVNKYQLEFYDIVEKPPKATVVIRGESGTYTLSTDGEDLAGNQVQGTQTYKVVNNLTGILEIDEEWDEDTDTVKK